MSTIEVKDDNKRSATQIKRLATAKSASNSDNNESIRVPGKKSLRTVILPKCKQQGLKTLNHHGDQLYCVRFKKVVINEQKYMPHSSEKILENIPTNILSSKYWEET